MKKLYTQIENRFFRMPKVSLLAYTIFLAVLLSCKTEEPPPVLSTPTLTDITPNVGTWNDIVFINGENFGVDATIVDVTFKDSAAVVRRVSNNQMEVIVPEEAGTGPLTITIGEHVFTSIDFTYETFVLSGTIVSTTAGSSQGLTDGPADKAKFKFLQGVATDQAGNIFVADMDNHRIRKISTDGEVSTFAGSEEGLEDGIGSAAKFKYPGDIVIDAFDNVYVADMNNHCIRKISPEGEVITMAGTGFPGVDDGPGISATFSKPVRLTIDADGNLFVVGYTGHRVRKVTPEGVVSTIAGSSPGYEDGTGSEAKFFGPHGIAMDSEGNLYVGEYNNHTIRKVTQAGVVSTLAGSNSIGDEDGTGASAKFNAPAGVAIDLDGNILVCDVNNHKIRMITPEGIVTTVAGIGNGYSDGTEEDAKFNLPIGITVHTDGTIYVGDRSNNKVRKIEIIK